MSVGYAAGTISVTSGSKIVTGDGTEWVTAGVRRGWIIRLPNGSIGWIDNVVSNTSLELADEYSGSTQSGQPYRASASGGLVTSLADSISQLREDFQGVVEGPGEGKFPNGNNAEPSVRGDADQDTGVNFPGISNTLDLVTGGTRRGRLSSSAFQIDVPVTGTAVTQSSTDDTAGRLMKVGDGGLLGSTSSINDWDTFDKSRVSNILHHTDNNTSNSPWDNWLGLLAIQRDTNRVGFLGIRTFGLPNAQIGYYDGDTTQVETLYHTGNLVGTVSEEGGDPTGAVIERGSNSNGEYVRFADGTQICKFRDPDNYNIAQDETQDFTWSFPAAFASGSELGIALTAMPERASLANTTVPAILGATYRDAMTATQASYGLTNLNSNPTFRIHLTATGRWF